MRGDHGRPSRRARAAAFPTVQSEWAIRHAVDREDRVGGPGDAVRRECRGPEVVEIGRPAEVGPGTRRGTRRSPWSGIRGRSGDRDGSDLVTLEDGDPGRRSGSGCPPQPVRQRTLACAGVVPTTSVRWLRSAGDHERSHRHALHHIRTVILSGSPWTCVLRGRVSFIVEMFGTRSAVGAVMSA